MPMATRSPDEWCAHEVMGLSWSALACSGACDEPRCNESVKKSNCMLFNTVRFRENHNDNDKQTNRYHHIKMLKDGHAQHVLLLRKT